MKQYMDSRCRSHMKPRLVAFTTLVHGVLLSWHNDSEPILKSVEIAQQSQHILFLDGLAAMCSGIYQHNQLKMMS